MAEISAWDPTDASNVDLFPENMAFSAVNDGGRAVQGVLARWFRDINGGLASSGSSNAFAVTSNRTISSLVDGIRLTFRANHAITGAATLNLNAIGAKDIKRFNGDALASGDIVSGQPVDVIYSSALDEWIMVSALAALTGNMFADFGENASPGDPAADTARLYSRDDGSGVTELAWRDSAGAVSVLRQATAANMEAAAADRLVPASLQHRHPGHPKVVALFRGSDGALLSDYGVDAVTRNGTGDYTVTFDTAFSSANYVASILPAGAGENVREVTRLAGSMSFETQSNAGANEDPTNVSVICWGDFS